MRARADSWQRDPRAGALALVVGLSLAALLLLIGAIALAPGFIAADLSISAAIRSAHLPGGRTIALVSTFVGDLWPMTVLTLATAAWLYHRGHRTGSLAFMIAMAGGATLGALLKVIVARARPAGVALIPLPDTYGFPSGHALSSFIYFGSLALIVLSGDASMRRKIWTAVACGIASLAVGTSRVLLGVHYLGDVVGAWVFGSAWLAIVMLFALRWGTGANEGTPHDPSDSGVPKVADAVGTHGTSPPDPPTSPGADGV